MVVKKKAKRKLSATEEVMGVRYHRKAHVGKAHAREEERNEMTETVKDAAGAMMGLGAMAFGFGALTSLMGTMKKD